MASIKTASFIAYKSILKGNKSTLLLLIFILSLSFLNLMFITGILKGLTTSMTNMMIDTSLGHIIIYPQEDPTEKEYIFNARELQSQISTIPGVEGVIRHQDIGGSISFDREKDGKSKVVNAAFIGINPREEKKVLKVYERIVEGVFPEDLQNDEIIISTSIVGGYGSGPDSGNHLGGARVGDEVTVSFNGGLVRNYTIRGIYDVSIGPSTNSVFFNINEIESILSTHNTASEMMVRVDLERDELSNYYKSIVAMAPNLEIKEYEELMDVIGTMLDAFDLISYIVSVISIAVAAITIFVLIYVNAVNKRKQIGILKAIGIKEEIIELSYVIQSFFYALCSVAVGSIVVFMVLVPYFDANPIALPFGDCKLVYTNTVIIVGVSSLIISGIVAGYLPARIVAKEDIIKAIWG